MFQSDPIMRKSVMGNALALLTLVLAGCNGGGGDAAPAASGNTPPAVGGAAVAGNSIAIQEAWRPKQPPQQNWPGAALAGYYECVYSKLQGDGSYIDKPSHKFDLYPENQAWVYSAESYFELHSYEIDTSRQTLKWGKGTFSIYWKDGTRYWFDASGTPVIELTDAGVYGNEYLTCTRSGPVKDKSPYQKELAKNDPETELQPASVAAPQPAPGAGGLTGLFQHLNGSGSWMYDGFGGSNWIPASSTYYYFRADGYYYEGLYPWSYDALDCRRMKTDGKPLCGTYQIDGKRIRLDNGNWQDFDNTGSGGIKIGDKFFSRDSVAPTTLNGRWSMTDGASLPNGGGAYATSEWILRSDGTFETGVASSVMFNSSPSWADSNTSGVAGSSDSHTGRYSIRDYTLTLEYNDGTVVKKVLWISDKDSDPSYYLYVNGKMFYRR